MFPDSYYRPYVYKHFSNVLQMILHFTTLFLVFDLFMFFCILLDLFFSWINIVDL
jgi:hypothetical protein